MFFLHLGLFFYFCMNSLWCSAMDNNLHVTFVIKEQDYTCYDTNKKLFGVAYPSNDTVLVLSDNFWSTFDPKTGDLKQRFSSLDEIQNFDLKGEMLATIGSKKIVLFNIKNGNKEYVMDVTVNPWTQISFLSSDNKLSDDTKMIIHDSYSGSMFTVTCDHEKYYIKNILNTAGEDSSFVAINLKSKELCVLNAEIDENSKYFFEREEFRCPVHKIFKLSAADCSFVKEMKHYDNDRALSCVYNSNGTVLAIQTRENGYVFYKVNDKKNQFHVKIDFENKTAYCIKPCYRAIAFHPYKSFVALVNQCDNSIEFHSYANKDDDTLLAMIAIDISKDVYDNFTSNKQIAFSPDGRTIVAIRVDKFYIIPTPFTVYFDKNTINKCIFLNFILNRYSFVPQDVKKLIFNNIAYSSDF